MKITLESINPLKQNRAYLNFMIPGLEKICTRLIMSKTITTTPQQKMYKSLRNKLEELRGDWDHWN